MRSGVWRPRPGSRRAEPGRGGGSWASCEDGLRRIAGAFSEAVLVVDHTGRIAFANDGAGQLLGLPSTELVGRPVEELLAGGLPLPGSAPGGPGPNRDVVIRWPDGATRVAEAAVTLDLGEQPHHLVVLRDVTERRETAEALALRATRQSAVAALGERALSGLSLPELLAGCADQLGDVLAADSCAALELGADGAPLVPRAAIGWPGELLDQPCVAAGAGTLVDRVLSSSGSWILHERDGSGTGLPPAVDEQFASGVLVPIEGRSRPWGLLVAHSAAPRAFRTDDVTFLESVAHVIGLAVERTRAEDEIRHRAAHDQLTGLSNRVLLLDRLGHALARAGRSGSSLAVLFVDVDHLKAVNDHLGHEAGDRLLQVLAERLQGALRAQDTVARLGGDEFVVVCEEADGLEGTLALASRLREAIRERVAVPGGEVVVSASIGLALWDGIDSATPESLVRDADLAMYQAKALGRDRIEVFDPSMRSRALERHETEDALRRALREGQLRLVYQPVVDLATGVAVGLQSRLRWERPGGPWVDPTELLPVAEESGLALPMGLWAIEEARSSSRAWGSPDRRVWVSVRLSAGQLHHPDLVDRLGEVVDRTGPDAARLAVEVTEDAVVGNGSSRVLGALKALGVGILVEDLAVGYSSLMHLKRLPIDAVKLDRSFVADLASEGADPAFLDAVFHATRALGVPVAAEGVETATELAELTRLGCDLVLGDLLAGPVRAEEVAALLGRDLRPGPAGGVGRPGSAIVRP
ncbi:MAG: EAL domain-containing protein [Acidimicrobiia bacterium]|nr:EAL domain-containing protein [Acidimicrobiia bacterium]